MDHVQEDKIGLPCRHVWPRHCEQKRLFLCCTMRANVIVQVKAKILKGYVKCCSVNVIMWWVES